MWPHYPSLGKRPPVFVGFGSFIWVVSPQHIRVATAYPLLLLHGTCKGHPIFFYFALIPLLLYIFDVTMRRSKITTTKVLEWNTHDDNGEHITELVLECPKNFVYTPGQYAELKFSPISTSHLHQWMASIYNSLGTRPTTTTHNKK